MIPPRVQRLARTREIPPPLELQCLKALWRLGEGSVHDVQELLGASRNLAYTTVMTGLDRLEKRGCVARRKQGRRFIYTPRVSRDTLRAAAVKELIDGFFDSSESELAEYLGRRQGRNAQVTAS